MNTTAVRRRRISRGLLLVVSALIMTAARWRSPWATPPAPPAQRYARWTCLT